MIKKWVNKHDFISGKPKYHLTYDPNEVNQNIFIGRDGWIVGTDVITIADNTNYDTNPIITLTNPNGGNIFSVSDDGIYYQNQPLATEDRLREIVREMMDEYFVPIREVQE